ncbi:TerD family protein [Breznakiellaceae bacterium SP9]
MSISLQKGQKISLEKDGGGELRQVIVGLGWDTAETGATFDLDASAILLTAKGKMASSKDFVYYNNKKHASGAVWSTGDNLTGEGEGDDEQLIVDLPKVPREYDKIVFVVSIYDAAKKKQHFGLVNNAFIRIVDTDSNKELMKYSLSDSYQGKKSMIFAEIYRKDGKWKFAAIGEALDDDGVRALSQRYL